MIIIQQNTSKFNLVISEFWILKILNVEYCIQLLKENSVTYKYIKNM